MYVCICKQVRSTEIQDAVERGARRLQDVSRQLGVGRQCGMCARHARELVRELANAAPAADPAATAA